MDIIYIRIKIRGVYGAYLRVYEVLSVSLGLVLILCVNALACQPVGNVEFCRMLLAYSWHCQCHWRYVYICTSLSKACVMWILSDVKQHIRTPEDGHVNVRNM